METAPRQTGRTVSQMVQALEDSHQRLVEDNIKLRQERDRQASQIAELRDDLTNAEAERDDWKESATELKEENLTLAQARAEAGLKPEQAKADVEQQPQLPNITLQDMDREAWIQIITSREGAYQMSLQKVKLENARLVAVIRNNETEMAVMRSFCMESKFLPTQTNDCRRR
jgi:hypothetical protein